MRKIMIGVAFFLVLCQSADSQPDEDVSRPPPLKLTLQAAVFLALSNNIDIRVERLQPQIAETDIEAEESVFDPSVKTEISEGASRRQSEIAIFLTGADEPFQNTVEIDAGVQKKLSTGATAQLELENRRLSSNSFIQRFNPSWATGVRLSVSQPLLKDFGRDFNLGRIAIAKNNKHISDIQFKKRAIDVITLVKQTYWDLLLAIELLDVAQQSLGLAQELLEINKAKVEVGQLAPIDAVEAEAGVATREEAVILAQDTIHDLEDRLRSLLDIDADSSWLTRTIIPIDRPSDSQYPFSLRREVKIALKNRPDYLQAKADLENRLINLKLAKNQVWPRIDLVASAGLTGLGALYEDSLEEIDGDFYDLRIGLRFEYPLGNRAAKSQLVRRKLERQQLELTIGDLERNITLEVREAIRQVGTDFKRIKTTRVARRLAEKKLEAEQAKFEVGISTTKDVLDFQIDLAVARSRESRALIDYNKSLVTLHQSLGTTIEESGITPTDTGT
jgi:outer membrane protein TolC